MAIKFYGYTEDEVNAITDPIKQSSRDVVYAKEAFRLIRAAAGYNAEAEKAYENLFSQYSLARDNRSDLPEPFALPVPAYAQILVAGADAWPFLTYSTTERVCATKAWTPAAKPELARGKVGPHVYDDPDGTSWFGWLPGDLTMPGQAVHTVSSDGVEGIFVKQKSLQSGDAGKGGQVAGYYVKKG